MSLANDKRESFPTLEDASGEGSALSQMQQGDSPVLKNGAIGFAFRDSAGNVVLPQLLPTGAVPVDQGAPGTPIMDRDENAGSLTPVDVASLTLTASETYCDVAAIVSCFQETLFELVQVNNATTTVLADILVGPGQYTFKLDYEDCVAAGATGTQVLKIRGTNFKKTSTMRATLRATEVA
jgi:hypothetical protein